jgi:hypothetical protein
MTLDDFIAAAGRRAQVCGQPGDEEEPDPPGPPFSIRAIVEEHGNDYIRSAIHLMWQEFQDLFLIVEHSIRQKGRGRRRKLDEMDRLFVLMIYLTSESTIKKIAVNLNVNQTSVERTIQRTLDEIQEPLDALFPGSEADV